MASILQNIASGAYNISGARDVMKGVRGIRKNGLDLGDVGNIALGLGQGALLAIPGGGGALAAGRVAAAAAKTAGAGRVARQIPRVGAVTKGLNPKTYAPTFGRNIKTSLTTPQGLLKSSGRVAAGTALVTAPSLLSQGQTTKTQSVKPNTQKPSLISIQANNSQLRKPPSGTNNTNQPTNNPNTKPPFYMPLPNFNTPIQPITRPTIPITPTKPLPDTGSKIVPKTPTPTPTPTPTQPQSNVTGSTGKSITPQPPRTQPVNQGASTSTATQQPTAQNLYPHFGPNGEYLGDFKYPQATYKYQTVPQPTTKTVFQQPQVTQQAPVRDLAREEAEIKAAQQAQINEIYNQRLAREKEQEMLRQQQLNAARASDLQQQVSIIDARSTGVPPWMIAAKQRYEAGLGRSQALGAVREQDIRDLLSQRQMAARGRAAGMVGGRSTGILGSSLTGARRGYDLGIRNETLRRIEEQAALKERYDEYLSEAARQASLQQLEDAQERANIIQQIRSLGGSI